MTKGLVIGDATASSDNFAEIFKQHFFDRNVLDIAVSVSTTNEKGIRPIPKRLALLSLTHHREVPAKAEALGERKFFLR